MNCLPVHDRNKFKALQRVNYSQQGSPSPVEALEGGSLLCHRTICAPFAIPVHLNVVATPTS